MQFCKETKLLSFFLSAMVQHQACLDSKAVEAGIDECGRRSDQIKPLTQTQICK